MPAGPAGSLTGMDHLTVRRCTVADLEQAPEFAALGAEYAAESVRADLGSCAPQMEAYKRLEDLGVMHFAGAWLDGALVGLVSVGATHVPHYAGVIATTESYFVRPHARKTGAGKMLLDLAEDIAMERGAVGLFVSAPTGGRLAVVLPRTGYQRTNEVFFKRLA
jgi:GNAT superfamily N-acetyltransferase